MRVAGGSIFDPATGIDLKAPTTETYADRISGGVTDVPRLVGQVVAGAAKGAMSSLTFGIWADEPAFQPRTKLEGAGIAWGGFSASAIGAIRTGGLPKAGTPSASGSAQFAAKRAGSKGNATTQQQIADIVSRLGQKGQKFTHKNGGTEREFYFPGPGGKVLGSNRSDLTFEVTRKDGTKYFLHINTADVKANGQFTTRELTNYGKIKARMGTQLFPNHRIVLIKKKR